jgi:medium-chain acyl-[acyl-carrier-protein] hydrolase
MRDHGRWIVRPRPNPDAQVRLVCVPHAGGGPVVFHNWPASLPPSIEVCALQLPGRAARLREAPFLRMAPLVDAVMAHLVPLLDRPIAFFGHSLGALVSFQVAQRLRQTGAGTLWHMFVSACRAPHLPRLCRALHRLPDADLIEELRRLNGMPQRLIDEPDLIQLVLPAVRADLTVFETYECAAVAPLSCPITAFGGLADRKALREDLEPWAAQTRGAFELHMLAGDHFFPYTACEQMLPIIARRIA